MSAQRHRRVRPGSPSGYPTSTPVTPVTAVRRVRRADDWDNCDYCGTSMTGQHFRGDKCLDCRVRDGEAEVDENGEEIDDGVIPHRTTTIHGPCWCSQEHGRVTPDADDDDETIGAEGPEL